MPRSLDRGGMDAARRAAFLFVHIEHILLSVKITLTAKLKLNHTREQKPPWMR